GAAATLRALSVAEILMPNVQFDRFYRYAELTELLKAFATELPQLVSVESIGRSHEGRDIWVATVTNTASGPASEKPAFWVDGNGRILQMRVPDSNGLWRSHPEDPRLMVRRQPTEVGGKYYRVLPEGRLDGYDGFTLKIKKPKQGIDLNRNFPSNWRQEFEQLGAGPFPTSEPEVRAVAEFIIRHPNIVGGVAFHTWSGVLLRPFDHLPDTEMHGEDLWHYQRVGAKGTEL